MTPKEMERWQLSGPCPHTRRGNSETNGARWTQGDLGSTLWQRSKSSWLWWDFHVAALSGCGRKPHASSEHREWWESVSWQLPRLTGAEWEMAPASHTIEGHRCTSLAQISLHQGGQCKCTQGCQREAIPVEMIKGGADGEGESLFLFTPMQIPDHNCHIVAALPGHRKPNWGLWRSLGGWWWDIPPGWPGRGQVHSGVRKRRVLDFWEHRCLEDE